MYLDINKRPSLICHNDMNLEEGKERLTECFHPLPIYKQAPFSLTCESSGNFTNEDIKWFLNGEYIQPPTYFYNHPNVTSQAGKLVLDSSYLIDGRMHFIRAKGTNSTLTCEIFGEKSLEFTLDPVKRPLDGSKIKRKHPCFLPNLMSPKIVTKFDIDEYDNSGMVIIFDRVQQGKRKEAYIIKMKNKIWNKSSTCRNTADFLIIWFDR